MFKKQVDSQSKVGENYQEGNCEYSMNTGRIIMCIGSILIVIMVFYLFNIRTEIENLYVRRHESLALMQFFNLNVLPMILIVRNENMLNFFKNEIKTLSLYMVICPLFVIHVLSCKQLWLCTYSWNNEINVSINITFVFVQNITIIYCIRK